MTSDTGVASILGFEKQIQKDQANGYAGLDENVFLSVSKFGYMSLIPSGIYVESNIPFMDDVVTHSNLIFVPNGHYIAFDDLTERMYLVKS
ncbi:hypothetical protein METP3_03025 [Methanosarcinales archaeon]|nr:hypothetical protein METP3_03025 [Methanosarcinales archaeon]